jgi:N-acetylneuraminic acid mutarotase
MPDAFFTCAACAIGSIIYVFGGISIALRDSVRKYDTAANIWSTLAPMPSARNNHSAVFLDGLVYIVGAHGVQDDGREILRYDPAADAWSTLAPVMIGKYLGTSLFVLGGNLYAARYSANVERYDVDTDTWMAMSNMLEGRTAFCSFTIASAGPAEEENLFDKLIATANIRIHL